MPHLARYTRWCCSSDAAAPLIPHRHAIRMTTRWRSPWTTPPSWTSSSLRCVRLPVPSQRSLAACLHVGNMYQSCPLACWQWNCLCVCVCFQIEDIRNSIDKIDGNVAEVKKLYSVILSAPTSDQSKNSPHPVYLFACCAESLQMKRRYFIFNFICFCSDFLKTSNSCVLFRNAGWTGGNDEWH